MVDSLRRQLFGTGADQRRALREFDFNRPTDEKERIARFLNAAYALYWKAQRARELAASYRHFCVGCAGLAYRPDLPLLYGRFQAFGGMNSKIEEGSKSICAEPIVLQSALSSRYIEIPGMVVVGETQEDERGITPPTLRPCPHCRLLLRNSSLIRPWTIIITALPPPHPKAEWNEITYEIHTFSELLQEYKEEG